MDPLDLGPHDVTPPEAIRVSDLTAPTYRATPPVPGGGELDPNEQDSIPEGTQDNAITALCGFVRGHPLWRLSEVGMVHFLAAACSNGTLDVSTRSRPHDERDYKRIAGSMAHKPAGLPSHEVDPHKLRAIRGDAVSFVGPPIRWWIRGFFPHAELVMMYGPKSAGKSTTASWLAATVTKTGGRFLHIGVEEPYERFLARAVLGGAERTLIYSLEGAISLRIPKSVESLKQFVIENRIDMVYFDSIYSHFESSSQALESTRARTALGPLAAMAQETGCTVIGVFHDNKGGEYMGSTEMINVPRVVLHLTKLAGESPHLRVKTTNFTDPECSLRLDADEVDQTETNGKTQMETLDDGTEVPMKIRVIREFVRVAKVTAATLVRTSTKTDSIASVLADMP